MLRGADARPSIAGLVAAVIALVMVAVYLMLIAAENEDNWCGRPIGRGGGWVP